MWGTLAEYAPVGATVFGPLLVVLYGYRTLKMASGIAGFVKLGLGVAFGVGLEAARRTFGMTYGEVVDLLVGGLGWVFELVSGVLG